MEGLGSTLKASAPLMQRFAMRLLRNPACLGLQLQVLLTRRFPPEALLDIAKRIDQWAVRHGLYSAPSESVMIPEWSLSSSCALRIWSQRVRALDSRAIQQRFSRAI
eukprot:scaffold1474_cov256-Pinguiococcus_pyrenoidosus.AAC.29